MPPVLLIIVTLSSCSALPTKQSNLRIVGGKTAAPGQFPFVVSINVTSDVTENGRNMCAGSIIHENWVLTTAICSEFSGQMVVISGTNRLDINTGVVYNVSRIVAHPNYTQENFPEANIALFQIDGSFNFSDLVQSIEIGEVSVDDTALVAGWGDANPALQYTELTVWSNEDCKTETEFNNIGSGEVCAFREGAGLCVGDLAAPLVHDGTLVGLGSWGFWCGEYPDVYTRVSYFKDWINNVIES